MAVVVMVGMAAKLDMAVIVCGAVTVGVATIAGGVQKWMWV